MANFNVISPFYDQLAKLVFGYSLENSTRHYLPELRPNEKVLIMGGGNGEVLRWLDALKIPLQVTYVEISSQMMSRSKKKGPFEHIIVRYIEKDASSFKSTEVFDVVLTPFFLDCFSSEKLDILRSQWAGMLRSGGSWIFADFVSGSSLQFMIPVMYGFFRVMAGLKVMELPDYTTFFKSGVFQLVSEASYYSGLISAKLYKKL